MFMLQLVKQVDRSNWYVLVILKQADRSICFRITSTKCRINTVVSPDDGQTVARNMQRKEINILRKTVHQVGFIYKIIQGRTVNKTYNLFTRNE